MAERPDRFPTRDASNHGNTKSANRFPCSQCKATFNRAAHLRRHQKTHRGEKPFSCQYCPLASSRKDVIIRHTRNFHPEIISRNEDAGGKSHISSTPNELDSALTTGPGQFPFEPDSTQFAPAQHLLSHFPQSHEIDDPFLNGGFDLDFLSGYQCDTQSDLYGSPMAHQPLNSDFLNLSGTNLLTFPPQETVLETASELGSSSPSSSLLEAENNETAQTPTSFFVGDDDYSKAQENLSRFIPAHLLENFQFPSKFAMIRFVKAFFNHMAPHLPILHRPTFNVANTPSPLLLEIMACGAIYLSEHDTAASLHAVSLQLVSENERLILSGKRDCKFQLWLLQTYILLTYFGTYGCGSEMEQRAIHTFPFTVMLAQEGVQELKQHPVITYEDWVYQESISRCISGTIVIAAALSSVAKDRCFTPPILEAKFSLPSTVAEWLRDKQSWGGPCEAQYSSDALSSIFAGRFPTLPMTEFGFVTVISAVLCRICSFETLATAHHGDLYTSFVERMDISVRMIDRLLKQHVKGLVLGSTPTPLIQCAFSLLNSVFYHLYGSQQLASMKRLLRDPSILRSPQGSEEPLIREYSSWLEKALLRAAEAWRSDCRLGLKYVQKVAPHRFAPLCATACCEGGLLLFWYLQTKHSSIFSLESQEVLERFIKEGIAEVEGLRTTAETQPAVKPLTSCAELLNESSVWRWPCTVSRKLTDLVTQLKLTPIMLKPLYGNEISRDSTNSRKTKDSQALLIHGF